MCVSEVLWSSYHLRLTSSDFEFHVTASGPFPDVEFGLTHISMRYLELLHSGVSQAVKTALPGEMITSFRERKPQECFEEENISPRSAAQKAAGPAFAI